LDAIHEVLTAANADLDRALGVEHPGFNGQTERGAVSEFRAEELTPGVGVSVDVHHANRRPGGNGLEYGIGNGVIPAGADRYDVRCLDLAIEGLDILVLPFQVVPVREVHVTEIGDPAQVVRVDAQAQGERPHEAGRI